MFFYTSDWAKQLQFPTPENEMGMAADHEIQFFPKVNPLHGIWGP